MKQYLPVALDLDGVSVLVVGGDAEAADKAEKMARAGARVTVVAPAAVPALLALAARRRVHLRVRGFTLDDLRGCRVVVLTPRDAELGAVLRSRARRDGFLFCAIDQPALCDFVQPAVSHAGPITIALSSGGAAPALLKRVRLALDALFDAPFTRFAAAMAAARAESPETERRARMDALLEGFGIEARVRYPSWWNEREPRAP